MTQQSMSPPASVDPFITTIVSGGAYQPPLFLIHQLDPTLAQGRYQQQCHHSHVICNAVQPDSAVLLPP